MKLLGFDTSGPYCAAALLIDGAITVSRSEEMARGQAERLMPLLEEVLADGGCIWSDLDAIGVGVGPGNFTGIRISVSGARGLALGLNVRAVGVTTFDALRAGSTGTAAVPAPREMAYVQTGSEPPELMPRADVPTDAIWPGDPAALAAKIAQLACTRMDGPHIAPAPFYLRPADAAPSSDPPPVILDDA